MHLRDFLANLALGAHVIKTSRGLIFVVVREHTCETEYSRKFFLKVIKKYKNAVVIDAEKCRYAVVYNCAEYRELCADVKKYSSKPFQSSF